MSLRFGSNSQCKAIEIDAMKIEVIDSPDNDLMQFFDKKIEEFNLARWEVTEKFSVAIRVLNDAGEIVAGAAAKTFYEKHGYVVKWTQPNYPKDGCKYFMMKELEFIKPKA